MHRYVCRLDYASIICTNQHSSVARSPHIYRSYGGKPAADDDDNEQDYHVKKAQACRRSMPNAPVLRVTWGMRGWSVLYSVPLMDSSVFIRLLMARYS